MTFARLSHFVFSPASYFLRGKNPQLIPVIEEKTGLPLNLSVHLCIFTRRIASWEKRCRKIARKSKRRKTSDSSEIGFIFFAPIDNTYLMNLICG